MKFSQFKNSIILPFDKLQKEVGDSFLELMVDNIVLLDHENHEITALFGWDYNLSRSRHWDKEQEIHIMYDGLTCTHIQKLYDDIMSIGGNVASVVLSIEGMNDLEEPIKKEIILEIDTINE